MKKYYTAILAVLMLLNLVSCGEDKPKNNTGSKTEIVKNTSKKTDIKLPEGWRDGIYETSRENVWDSAVLPKVLPPAPAGIKANNTNYKPKDKITYNDNNYVGQLRFPDSNFEKWSVNFDGTQANVDELVDGLIKNGFVGGLYASSENTGLKEYEFGGNGYYVHIWNRTSYYQDGVNFVTLTITPDVHKKPKTFNGAPLPQSGILHDDLSDFTVVWWDKNDDNKEKEVKWDVFRDKGMLPESQWVAWFDYFGTPQDAKAYADEMVKAGWTLTNSYQDEPSEYTSYTRYGYSFKKGEIYAYIYNDGAYLMRLGFADIPESLSS